MARVVSTTIYGSGDGDEVLPRAGPFSDPFAIFAQILSLPLQVLNTALQSITSSQTDDDMGQRKYRSHTPHGELVQTMSTQELNKKNIFGSGGSQ